MYLVNARIMMLANDMLPINLIQGINISWSYEIKDKKKWIQLKSTMMCISSIYQQHSGVQL